MEESFTAQAFSPARALQHKAKCEQTLSLTQLTGQEGRQAK